MPPPECPWPSHPRTLLCTPLLLLLKPIAVGKYDKIERNLIPKMLTHPSFSPGYVPVLEYLPTLSTRKLRRAIQSDL